MPLKRAGELKEAPECILRIGKYNNVVAWNLEMRSVVGTLHGSTANFLTDNLRYIPPYLTEEDYIPVNPALAEGVAPAPMPAALLAKLQEDCLLGDAKRLRSNAKTSRRFGHSCGRACLLPRNSKSRRSLDTPPRYWRVTVYCCGSTCGVLT